MFSRTAGDIVAEVKMVRTTFSGALLLVEGPTDSRFWSARTNLNTCQIIICDGKDNAIAAAVRADAEKLDGLLCVVDDDLDSITGVTHAPNIVPSDEHDLEATMLSTSALDTVICCHAQPRQLKTFCDARGLTLRDIIVSEVWTFGALRTVKHLKSIEICFDDYFSVHRYLDASTFRTRTEELKDEFALKTSLPRKIIDAELKTLETISPWRILNGHDVIDALWILGVHLQFPERPSKNQLFTSLSIAFSRPLAESTKMWSRILLWSRDSRREVLAA